MRARIGELLLILGIILFVIGGIDFVVDSPPLGVTLPMCASAIIFVGVGASMKRQALK